MQETWYVLEDGTFADPNEVAPDDAGTLRHKDGLAVAMRGQVPHSRGVDPEEERAKAVEHNEKKAKELAAAGNKPKTESREVVAEEPKKGYATREVKSR